MGESAPRFWKHAAVMFLALRAGDAINLIAGLWLVPKYVSAGELGAVLPLANFATFAALPAFAFALVVMREASVLAAHRDFGRLVSLLRGGFATAGTVLALALVGAVIFLPRFLSAMRVLDAAAGYLTIAAAVLGCGAPVFTDALQSLLRFGVCGAIEIGAATARLATLVVAMPVRALAGYFAGAAVQPLVRIALALVALRHELAAPPAPFWDAAARARLFRAFLGALACLGAPMLAATVEQSILRAALPDADSAGYYMATRLSDLLNYLTLPLFVVLFPHAARAGAATRRLVAGCTAVTFIAAAALAGATAIWGRELLALLPNGALYVAYAPYIPWLVLVGALGAAQNFVTNAEMAADRYGYLTWLVPLNLGYAALLWTYGASCATLESLLVWMSAVAALRFVFATITWSSRRRA